MTTDPNRISPADLVDTILISLGLDPTEVHLTEIRIESSGPLSPEVIEIDTLDPLPRPPGVVSATSHSTLTYTVRPGEED